MADQQDNVIEEASEEIKWSSLDSESHFSESDDSKTGSISRHESHCPLKN